VNHPGLVPSSGYPVSTLTSYMITVVYDCSLPLRPIHL
jgi:hypothetical protein